MPNIVNLASGSRGNATVISTNDVGLLIDAGISACEIDKRLRQAGQSVSAVLITHEHIDHVRGLAAFCRDHQIPAYVHQKVAPIIVDKCGVSPDLITEFGDTEFVVGPYSVTPFRIPHDTVYPVGFVVRDNTGTCGIATDLGQVTRGIAMNLADCDTLLIESNHDVNMLLSGKYPPHLKQRIRSNLGHLSNEDCAELVLHLVGKKLQRVILGHISENNNSPRLARLATEKILAMSGIEVGKDVRLAVASPDTITLMK